MSQNSSEWHWHEGIKYAHEGIKLLFILNGASAVSVLTFIGNMKSNSCYLIDSLLFFSIGAATGVVAMVCAYRTQQLYGNAERHEKKSKEHNDLWKKAQDFNKWTVGVVLLGLIFFLLGVGFSAFGLSNLLTAT